MKKIFQVVRLYWLDHFLSPIKKPVFYICRLGLDTESSDTIFYNVQVDHRTHQQLYVIR